MKSSRKISPVIILKATHIHKHTHKHTHTHTHTLIHTHIHTHPHTHTLKKHDFTFSPEDTLLE